MLLAIGLSGACSRTKNESTAVQTAPVTRRDIVVEVEATGTIEPINVVEVKSKSSGQIVRMPVETGSQVKPGDLLVQLDTRDVKNQYDQTFADVRAAEAKLAVSSAQKRRSDTLFAQRVITAQEHESAALDYANAQAQLVRARTNLDLAQQRLEDATVRAPVTGTVIEKTVSLGQVIASGTNALGGGTTILKMADLNAVRARVLVTETDIGQVQPGQTARVTVDAYPSRPFSGVVEKIEPQAVVQQSVTMFPVLVTLSNREGLLKPGMNGEVAMLVDRRENVLAVPNDAVRSVREAAAVATILGLNPDSVRAKLQAQFQAGGMGGTGRTGGTRQGAMRQGDGGPVRMMIPSPGSLGGENGEPQQRAPQMPEVSEAQCAQVKAAWERNPAARGKLEELRRRMMAGEVDRDQMREQQRAIYAEVKLDPMVARACTFRERGGALAGDTTAGGGGSRSAAAGPGRPGLVFVGDSGRFEPRVVMLGVSNYDFTEVISGAREGETVALLAAAAMQLRRQEQSDRARSMGGVPGMTQTPSGARGGGRP